MIVDVLVRGREAHSRSFFKAVSWRITGSVDTFVLSYIITGNAKIAGSIATVEVITKIILYYLHERVWGIIPWGRADRYAASPAAKVHPRSTRHEQVARLVG
jgi:uncharacterized membrane protein